MHDPAAHPGAERQHDQVLRPAPRAEPPLGERRRVRVVLDAPPGRRSARSARVPSSDSPSSGMLIEPSATAGACGRAPTGSRSRAPPRPLRRAARSPPRSPPAAPPASPSASAPRGGRATRPVAVDRPGEDLRAAEIDAYDSLGGHRPRLPYPAGWRTEKSPTGSTRAAGPRGRCRPRPARSGAGDEDRPRQHAAAGRAGGAGSGSAIALLVVLLVVWLVASYLSFRAGVADANAPPAEGRRGRASRRRTERSLSKPTLIAAARHRRRHAPRRAPTRAAPTRSCSSAPTPAGTGSRTSRSRATCASRSPATARTRSTPPSSSAGPR